MNTIRRILGSRGKVVAGMVQIYQPTSRNIAPSFKSIERDIASR
jgi:hypothetical protein